VDPNEADRARSAPERKAGRLTAAQARERAARACGVEVIELSEGTEHGWGWSFVLAEPDAGAGPVFVDAGTGLVATSAAGDDDRIATLQERGPLGVPPWSPPPKLTWWQELRSALGFPKRSR
jgi:hypothetical protein